MLIADKVVVVTGGASGIGRALCRKFAQEGAKAISVVDMDEEGAKAVADEISALHSGFCVGIIFYHYFKVLIQFHQLCCCFLFFSILCTFT